MTSSVPRNCVCSRRKGVFSCHIRQVKQRNRGNPRAYTAVRHGRAIQCLHFCWCQNPLVYFFLWRRKVERRQVRHRLVCAAPPCWRGRVTLQLSVTKCFLSPSQLPRPPYLPVPCPVCRAALYERRWKIIDACAAASRPTIALRADSTTPTRRAATGSLPAGHPGQSGPAPARS